MAVVEGWPLRLHVHVPLHVYLYAMEPSNLYTASDMYMYLHHICQGSSYSVGMTTTTSSETSGEDEAHITVEVGVFGGEAVRETAQDICEELNGVSVGRMGQRILYMVIDQIQSSYCRSVASNQCVHVACVYKSGSFNSIQPDTYTKV